ncbi:MAG TPA: hypothetical protein VK558_11165 [Patescibacteria group bacterium]|nr:hypothetical protein [Patescibacteria group bacterium]
MNDQQSSELNQRIDGYYSSIPRLLVDSPDLQKQCFGYLKQAQTALAANDEITCRMQLADIDVEMTVRKRQTFATALTLVVVYGVLAILLGSIYLDDHFGDGKLHFVTDGQIAGVYIEVWQWALFGTAAAMILRVSRYDFANRQEALRWAISRPVLGLVMGGLAYLIVHAGLFAFVGDTASAQPNTLKWVVAFLGGFSDTLSVTLLSKLQEKLLAQPPGKGSTPPPADDAAAAEPEAEAPAPAPEVKLLPVQTAATG